MFPQCSCAKIARPTIMKIIMLHNNNIIQNSKILFFGEDEVAVEHSLLLENTPEPLGQCSLCRGSVSSNVVRMCACVLLLVLGDSNYQ